MSPSAQTQVASLRSKSTPAVAQSHSSDQLPTQDAVVEVVRLLACLMVVAYHLVWAFAPQASVGMHNGTLLPKNCLGDPHLMSSIPFNLAIAGNFAVSLFFVLSGYVLPRAMFAKKQVNLSSLCGDLLKRFLRLAVPLWAFSLVGYLCLKLHLYEAFGCKAAVFSGSNGLLSCLNGYASADQSLMFTMVYPFEHGVRLIPPAWTLGIEMVGSILSYGLAAIIASSTAGLTIGLVIALLVPGYFKLFAIGTVFAYAEQRGLLDYSAIRTRLNAGGGLLSALCVTVCIFIASYPWYASASEINQYAPFYAPLIAVDDCLQKLCIAGGITAAAAVLAFFLVKVLLTDNALIKAISRFGKHTYTIYLSHMIILGTVCSWLFLNVSQGDPNRLLPAIAAAGAALVASIALVCTVATDIVDGNAIKLAKRLKSAYLGTLNENLDRTPVD